MLSFAFDEKRVSWVVDIFRSTDSHLIDSVTLVFVGPVFTRAMTCSHWEDFTLAHRIRHVITSEAWSMKHAIWIWN